MNENIAGSHVYGIKFTYPTPLPLPHENRNKSKLHSKMTYPYQFISTDDDGVTHQEKQTTFFKVRFNARPTHCFIKMAVSTAAWVTIFTSHGQHT